MTKAFPYLREEADLRERVGHPAVRVRPAPLRRRDRVPRVQLLVPGEVGHLHDGHDHEAEGVDGVEHEEDLDHAVEQRRQRALPRPVVVARHVPPPPDPRQHEHGQHQPDEREDAVYALAPHEIDLMGLLGSDSREGWSVDVVGAYISINPYGWLFTFL